MIKHLLNLNKSTRIITILLAALLFLPQSTLAEETSFKDNLGGTWYDSDDSNATPIGPSASYTIAAGQKLEIFSSASGYPQSESSIGYYVMKSIRFAIQQTYTSSQITVTLSQPSIAGGSDYTVIGGLNQSDQVFSWSLNEYYPTGIDLKQDQRLKLIIKNNSETESIPLTISSIEIVPIYDITIAGTEVDGDNASNIFAGGENDGKVSFTPATGDTPATLTLNGANIEGGVSCNLDALTIHLSGDNSLESIEGGGSLTFSGENNATLSLNFSDGIMRGFSSVDFGGYNLLSNSSPDVHYDDTDHRLVDYNSDNVADLTLTKKTIYPIWVYDDAGSDFNFKQITEDNKTNVLGDDYSSVSFDGNNTLNLKGAQIAHTFYDSFIIGESLNNLTIHLVGYNEIGGSDRNAFKFLGNNTTLSFTTSETLPGCLVTYGSLSHGQKEDIIYANSLSYNASDKKVCVPTANNTTTTYITGPTSVINPQDGVVYMYTNPSAYYASSATLTDRSGHAPTYIKVSSSTAGSTNTAALWPTSFPSSQTINKVTLQFDWGTCSNKDVTVQIKGIEEKTGENTTWVDNGEIYSGDEPISLSRANADGILEIPLTSAITSENIQLYFSSSQSFSIVPLSVSLKTGETATLKFEGLSDNYVRTVYGEDFTKPTLTNSNNLTLTYSSDDNSIATVDKDNGDINIVGLGTVMISVTGIDPTGVYVPATAYYDLSVNLAAPTLTPESGVYFLNDGKFTVTASTTNKLPAGYAQEDFTIEMAVDNGSSSNKFSHDFTTTGSHSIMARSFIDNPDAQMPIELYSNEAFYSYIIHNKPTFSVNGDTYDSEQRVKIGNLPSNFSANTENYPQVWYYLGDDEDKATQYTSADQEISVSESTKISVYILDEDSGKVVRSANVEAEYVIRHNPDLSFVDADNKPVEEAQYTIGLTDQALPTLKNENGVSVSYESSNSQVATVSETGIVTPVGVGTTTISVSSAATANITAGEASYTLTVYKALSHESISIEIADATYSGEALEPSVTVKDGETTLTQAVTADDGDYTISYSNNTNAAASSDEVAPTVTITGKGNYSGTATKTFSITTQAITGATVTINPEANLVFDGTAKHPEVTKVTIAADGATGVSEKVFNAETDYDVSYSDGCTNVGEYTATVTFKGNYSGTATTTFNITAATMTVTANGYEGTYDEKPHGITVTAPESATVKYGTQKGTYNLTESPTYTDAGTYMVHYQVTMDNYTTIADSATVVINKADISPTVTLEGWTYGATANTPSITGNTGNGTVTYTYKAEGEETFSETMPVAVGTHTIKATIAETTNYNSGEATTTFTISNPTFDPEKDITFAEGQKYASYYNANADMMLPSGGIAAYMITDIDGNTLITKAVSYIPKDTPVLIEKTEETVETENPENISFNMLKYAYDDITANGTLYILYNGAYIKATGTIPAGKCYLRPIKPSGARKLMIGNSNNGSTGIQTVDNDQLTKDIWFDLNGNRIDKPTKKGLYINNGKKVVLK